MTLARFPDKVFGPQDIQAMSTALEDVCKILDLSDEAKSEREFLAQNILALAHHGERSAALLRDRTLREIAYGQGAWPGRWFAPLHAGRFEAGTNAAGSE